MILKDRYIKILVTPDSTFGVNKPHPNWGSRAKSLFRNTLHITPYSRILCGKTGGASPIVVIPHEVQQRLVFLKTP